MKERSLALAQKTLSDNQKQVEIGTLAPLDVVRAQSSVATAEQDLIISKTNLQLQQWVIKNALTRSLSDNSPVVQADVIPTDIIQIPDQENLPPVDQLIQQAMANRPDYAQQKINLQNGAIRIPPDVSPACSRRSWTSNTSTGCITRSTSASVAWP